jgi:hypothetical protein
VCPKARAKKPPSGAEVTEKKISFLAIPWLYATFHAFGIVAIYRLGDEHSR